MENTTYFRDQLVTGETRPLISSHERIVLRDLAKQVADIAALRVMAERRELWARHNALRRVRPMILKDTHTCGHHPERFAAWTSIAQELVADT